MVSGSFRSGNLPAYASLRTTIYEEMDARVYEAISKKK